MAAMMLWDRNGQVVAQIQSQRDQGRIDTPLGLHEFSGSMPNERWKRQIGLARLAGLQAARALVKGGKLVDTGKKFRVYQKSGDLGKALEDFLSVKYTETISFQMPGKGYGKAGTIGDRQIILQSAGENGKPTIDVIKVVNRSDTVGRKEVYGKITDRITYED